MIWMIGKLTFYYFSSNTIPCWLGGAINQRDCPRKLLTWNCIPILLIPLCIYNFQLTSFRFKVEEDKIALFLEGQSLAERIENDQVFYIDYQDLEEYTAPATNTVRNLLFAKFWYNYLLIREKNIFH